MNYETHIKTSGIYRMQTQDGQFMKGQFILESMGRNGAYVVAKFVTEVDYEMVYINVEGKTFHKSEGEFYSFLNANIDNEVFNKATFTVTGNITSPEWTLTLG